MLYNCFLFCAFCAFVLFCVFFFSPFVHSYLFTISVQVYRPLSPGVNPIAVNKYQRRSYHTSVIVTWYERNYNQDPTCNFLTHANSYCPLCNNRLTVTSWFQNTKLIHIFVQIAVFWDVIPYSVAENYQRFWGTVPPRLQLKGDFFETSAHFYQITASHPWSHPHSSPWASQVSRNSLLAYRFRNLTKSL